jgi:hypothetical protein
MNDIDKRIMKTLTAQVQSLETQLQNSQHIRNEAAGLVEELSAALQATTQQLTETLKALEEVQQATLQQEIIIPEDWQIVPKTATHEIRMIIGTSTESGDSLWKDALAVAPTWQGGVKEMSNER